MAVAVQLCEGRTKAAAPFAVSPVPAGFTSPCESWLDRPLDFNELLIAHPTATFAVRVTGDSMTGAGIFPGDIAVIDRAVEPTDGRVVLAIVDGGFTIKRYRNKGGRVWLQAANPAYQDITLNEESAASVWGVVEYTLHRP